MLILCKENDKYGRTTVYYIVKKEPIEREIHYLSLRSRLNPELTYYVTALDENGVDDDYILALFKSETNRKLPLFVRV
nr:MAG TPA: hypothetical protein [Caudoviricetes sp.]